ncbi:MAG: TIM barrel protein [Atopobiaceae bacterium]|nr:TIM barrel protein [Atopobiaceae bacterium]
MAGYIRRDQVAGMNIHYLYYSLEYFLDTQAELGFESIELWGGAPHFYLTPESNEDVAAVRRKLDERGLTIRCFTPENCTYQYQFAAQTPLLFEKSLQYFSRGLEVAAELGSPLMQCNSGWGFWNEDREEAWKRSREMLRKLSERAEELGVTLVMESLRRAESQLVNTLADAKRMFDEVDHPNFKILLDTVPMSIEGETVQDWFDVFGDNIRHMHFVDCNPYGHLVWGDGNRDLEAWCKALADNGYDGFLGQEITDGKYYDDPREADRQNMEHYKRVFA